jgi:hypothetical protein
MSNDIIPAGDGGDLAPLSPSVPLSPSPGIDSGWAVPELDFLSEPYQSGNSQQVFGQDASNIPPQQLHQAINEIANLFSADTVWTKNDRAFVDAVVDWYKRTAFAPVPREYAQHSYDLRGFHFPPTDQPFVTALCNFCEQIGATEKQVKTALTWYAALIQKVMQSQAQPQQTQSNQMGATVDQLTDAQFAVVEKRCESDRQRAELELRTKWGWQYETNIELIRSYIGGLPSADRGYLLNAVAAGGEMLMNNASVLSRLYQQAVSAARVPNTQSGASIQEQISAIEALMRNNRKAYNADLALQKKLHDLYLARDGG